jgi:AraC-like DNA-binding protein
VLQLGITLFLLLSVAAIVRTLRIMRLGNALQLSALLFKVTLNFTGAALMLVTGAELPTAYRALALTLVFFQFLNPVALTIYFTPPKASHLPLALSIIFAGLMMPLLLWYGLIELEWVASHPIPVSLFGFDATRPGEFGTWSILYKVFTPAILATLIYQQITQYWVRGRGFLRAKLWEVFYLSSGLVRAITLVVLLAYVQGNFETLYSLLSIVIAISLLLDTGIILVFASSRPVQFYRDHGLHLAGTWSPELERIVTEASRPEHLINSKFQLAALAQASNIPSYRVTQIVSQGLGIHIKELINHFRLRRYDALVLERPDERIKALLAECGFNSYATYYAARRK